MMCVCRHVHMWQAEDSSVELGFSFHLDVGSGDWIKVIRC